MVESVYRHNKTWQFIRRPRDTFVPRAHCLPRLFSPNPRGGWGGAAEEAPFLLVWISDLAFKYLSLSQISNEIKAWAPCAPTALDNTSPDLVSALSISRPPPTFPGRWPGPPRHKNLRHDRQREGGSVGALRDSEGHSLQLTGAMELTSTSSRRSTASVGRVW